MNFFEYQEKARRKTFFLVLYFILAIIFIILSLDALFVSLVIYMKDPKLVDYLIYGKIQHYYFHGAKLVPNPQMVWKLFIHLGMIISPIAIAVIVIGSMFRLASLNAGGIAVAELAGAEPLDPNTRDPAEQRFVNVVEEMSIASGVPIPKLYVMRHEKGINAFVAGIKPEDTVMTITQGALEQLTRDELQGVIGHEYSHIFNSDMQVSVRLIGILGGLFLISQLGYFILRMFGRRNIRVKDDAGRGIFILILIGVGLYIIGYIGLFFGRLIKSAISRQRESLADASSIQYTRDPTGLVGALMKIQQYEPGTNLYTHHAEDISHICFGPPLNIMFTDLLATHPPITERIKAIDPDGIYAPKEIKQAPPDSKEKAAKKPLQPSLMAATAVLAGGGLLTTKNAIKSSIGHPTQDHLDLAKTLLTQLPESLKSIAHDPKQVANIFYALLLSKEESKLNQAKEILSPLLDQATLQQVIDLENTISQLSNSVILPLIDIALPSFKTNTTETRQTIYQTLGKLAALESEKLFQFALLAMVGKYVTDKTPQDNKIVFQDFSNVLSEISRLITFIISTSHKSAEEKDKSYDKIMKNFTPKSIPQPAIEDFNPIEFQLILNRLNGLSPLCKEKLLHACLECIEDDKVINLNEAEIVRTVAACLDCPIPPMIVTE
ncbi:MAG: M48 family metallopeptidase [Candidatus Berkiellales bacterium]